VQNSSHVLVVMRHARAESSAESDEERRLSPEGEAAARAAGSWLAGQDLVIDRVLLSSAARVLGTWEHLAAGAGLGLDPEVESALYTAGPESVLDLVRLTDETTRGLLVIGHNPTIASLGQVLDNGEGDEASMEAMMSGFPAGTLAVFEVPGAWADLGTGGGRLVAFHAPDNDD
jgi:phosphohistidine phosphatase